MPQNRKFTQKGLVHASIGPYPPSEILVKDMHNVLGRNMGNIPPIFLAKKLKKNFNYISDVDLQNMQPYSYRQLVFITGIPRVGFSHTTPVPTNTIPVLGAGKNLL